MVRRGHKSLFQGMAKDKQYFGVILIERIELRKP